MRRVDRLLMALGILFGLCCLLATAMPFTPPSWLPLEVRDLILSWGPLACLLVVVLMGITVLFPDLFSVTASRRTIVFICVTVGLAVVVVMLLRRCVPSGD